MEGQEAKEAMTPLDLMFLARELRASLAGGIIRKAHQYGKAGTKQLLLEVSCPGRGDKLLYWDSGGAFLTERKKPVPVEPPSFCMFLRKHLLGQKILNIRQFKFDMVLEIITGEHILVLESIPPGNAILCDSSYNVIMPLEIHKWRGRAVRPGEIYRHPRTGDNPIGMDFEGFHRLLNHSERELGDLLTVNLGFGPVYSREICHRAGLDSRAAPSRMPLQAALRLYSLIRSLLKMEARPVVYEGMVSSFPLETHGARPVKIWGSLSQALDDFFSAQALKAVEKKGEEEKAGEPRKAEGTMEAQEQAGDKWERISGESGEAAGLIRENLPLVESVLNGINKARESGLSWEEIKGRVMGEQSPEAQAVREIREGDAVVVVELGKRQVELDFRLGAEENAARYLEDMEWAKGKLAGAEGSRQLASVETGLRQLASSVQAVKLKGCQPESGPEPVEGSQTEGDLNARPFREAGGPSGLRQPARGETETPREKPRETPQIPEKPKRRRRKWFEKFQWFISSDGFLVIGGRDARQNEMIISKYMDPGDLVFHADIPGAAFVVIRSGGRGISEAVKKEAAELAAANSRAWSRGLGNMDIFCARPEQVSRSPPPGEYLPRGSFAISGERQWFRDIELKLSIGIAIDRENIEARAISGPVMPVRTHSDYFVTIRPGYKKSLELARDIKNEILIKASPEDKFAIGRVPLEDIQRLIPPGSGDIVDYGV